MIAKLDGKNAEELAQKTIEVLPSFKSLLNTITADNGKERRRALTNTLKYKK